MKMIYKYPLGNDIHHNGVYEVEIPRAAKNPPVMMQAPEV